LAAMSVLPCSGRLESGAPGRNTPARDQSRITPEEQAKRKRKSAQPRHCYLGLPSAHG
jgi:hypothetical protein